VLALEFFSSAELTLGSFPMIRRHNAIRFAFEKKKVFGSRFSWYYRRHRADRFSTKRG
jgi:hypothetical protein